MMTKIASKINISCFLQADFVVFPVILSPTSLTAAILLQLFNLLFDYDNFIVRVQRSCLNKQTEFSFFFHCYASKISYIPTPDSHSQIVNLFYAVEFAVEFVLTSTVSTSD